MNRERLWWFGWLVPVLLLAAVACNGVPTPSITNATLGIRYQAGKIVDPSDTFAPQDHMIQLVVDLENVLGGTTVGAKWYAVPDGGQARLLFSSDLSLDALNTSGQFALTSSDDLTPGKYQVAIYLNNKQDRTLNFQISKRK